MAATMASTETRRRLVEGKGLFSGLRRWNLGLKELDETWRRSRDGRR